MVYAGLDEGNTSVSNPASSNTGANRPAVLPLKHTRFKPHAIRVTRRKSLFTALRMLLSSAPARSH